MDQEPDRNLHLIICQRARIRVRYTTMERNHYKFPRFTHFPWEAVNITSYSGRNDSLVKPPSKSLRKENQVEDLNCRD